LNFVSDIAIFVLKRGVKLQLTIIELECGPMPNVMAALPNIGAALINAAKFGRCTLLECHAVTLPRHKTR